ncbi:MAG: glycoside hydrolase family 25 protein [Phocaeicola sp.]|uniref:glycoside hydrolase family 25 protein n=1 Tax=Phocaeicola sp. TaxID=2773926 RepID=UPI003F9EF55D
MNKLRHKSKTTNNRKTVKRKSVKRRKSRRNASKDLPRWLFYVLSILIAVVFLTVFFYFFIRPYSYRWKPCYGQKAYGVCMPSGDYIHGIDLSHYQGKINWNQLDDVQQGPFGIRFIFMKASEGGDLEDSTFRANFDSARVHGFIRGAYHFFNPNSDPIKQADFFIANADLDSFDLPPVLDIEKKGDNIQKFSNDVRIWLQRIEEHYRVKPIIYASYKFKLKYLNDSVFNSYPYWIAHYYVDSVQYQGQWKFWQHTDVGTLPGIKEKVDLNVFNGSLYDLKSMTLKKDF